MYVSQEMDLEMAEDKMDPETKDNQNIRSGRRTSRAKNGKNSKNGETKNNVEEEEEEDDGEEHGDCEGEEEDNEEDIKEENDDSIDPEVGPFICKFCKVGVRRIKGLNTTIANDTIDRGMIAIYYQKLMLTEVYSCQEMRMRCQS